MDEELNVACVGCVHGELDTIYNTLAAIEKQTGRRTHLVLCCGDFQSVCVCSFVVRLLVAGC